jgi:hypothetical protein
MKVSWPFEVALRREASSRLTLRWLKTVVSAEGKASVEASGGDRESEREIYGGSGSKLSPVWVRNPLMSPGR